MKNKKIIIVVLTIALVTLALQMSLFYTVRAGVVPIDATSVTGIVKDASTNLPLEGATITISTGDQYTTGSTGAYLFSYYSAPVDLSASKTWYQTNTATVTTVSPGSQIIQDLSLQPLFTITLTPATSSLPSGGTQTLTATVEDEANSLGIGKGVLFSITSGPNAGLLQFVALGTVDGHEIATLDYSSSSGTTGTDTVVAKIVPNSGIAALEDAPFIATATVT